MIRTSKRLLGSTDIACVAAYYDPSLALELPKSKTIGDVFMRLAWGIEQKSNDRMRRGNIFEPVALDTYAQHIGPVWRPELEPGEWWAVRHPHYEWATTSPDGLDAEPPNHRTLVEAKTWVHWQRNTFGPPGTDKMATRFLYQLAWSMACVDVDLAHLIVLFGDDAKDEAGEPDFVNLEPALYYAERDHHVEDMLFGYGERFMTEFVAHGMPPPVKPATSRRAWQRKVEELGLDPRSDQWIDLSKAKPDSEAVGSDGGDRSHPEDGA